MQENVGTQSSSLNYLLLPLALDFLRTARSVTGRIVRGLLHVDQLRLATSLSQLRRSVIHKGRLSRRRFSPND